MKSKTQTEKPRCPFCGQPIARPRLPEERKMHEFPGGSCQCGAVYSSDVTGKNVGAAMVDCLVNSCNQNWDLAWNLVPDEDYIEERIENYDEQTHQVVDSRVLDGRSVRGVICFVRLQKEIADIVGRDGHKRPPAAPAAVRAPAGRTQDRAKTPEGKRRRASKADVKKLVEKRDLEGLAALAGDDNKTLRFMQRLLYDPDEGKRWMTAHLLGQVCARLAEKTPGRVSDLLQRLFDASADSAATNWGLLEAIGSIIAARTDIFGAFTRHLLMFVNSDSTRIQVVWALGTIAKERPDLIRGIPFYHLFNFLDPEDPRLCGHTLRLLDRIKATEMRGVIEQLTSRSTPVTIYEEGLPVQTTLAELAGHAIKHMG